jgi:hypothetical protein
MFDDGYGQLGSLGALGSLGGGSRRSDTRNMGLDALVGENSIRPGNVVNSLANKLLMDWLNSEADAQPAKGGQAEPSQSMPQDTGYIEQRLAEMLAKGLF